MDRRDRMVGDDRPGAEGLAVTRVTRRFKFFADEMGATPDSLGAAVAPDF
jgi:hypothetical protein